LAELMGELAESEASTPSDEADLEDRLKAAAAVLQMKGPRSQLTNVSENAERTMVVGVLRVERPGTES
jgi:arginine/ornithine N-succinyltransferase beta subunit